MQALKTHIPFFREQDLKLIANYLEFVTRETRPISGSWHQACASPPPDSR
jgi:hypothetical protein